MSVTASLAESSEGAASSPPAAVMTAARVRSFVTTVGFTMAIVLLQLGQGVLLARLLGPIGRGQYAAAVLYSQVLLYIGLMGGLEVICGRAAVLAQRATSQTDHAAATIRRIRLRQNRLRRASLRLALATGSITMMVVIILVVVAMPDDKLQMIPLGLLCSLSIIGQHVVLMMTAVDRGTERFAAYNWRRFVAAAAFPVLIAVTALVAQITVTLACLLFVLASVISMATCLIDLPRPLSGQWSPSVGGLLHRSRPYGLSMLATDLFDRTDLLLVLWLAPLIEQGYYAAMVPAVYPLTVIPNTLGVYLFNVGADKSKRLSIVGVHKVLVSSILVQAIVTSIFMLVIGWLVSVVYGADFAPAVRYALWLAPASAIRGILQGIDGYLKGRGRPMACVTARLVGLVTLISVTAILLPLYGVIAVAMAVLASQVICLAILAAVMYLDCGKP